MNEVVSDYKNKKLGNVDITKHLLHFFFNSFTTKYSMLTAEICLLIHMPLQLTLETFFRFLIFVTNYVWHAHRNSDEWFYTLRISFRFNQNLRWHFYLNSPLSNRIKSSLAVFEFYTCGRTDRHLNLNGELFRLLYWLNSWIEVVDCPSW